MRAIEERKLKRVKDLYIPEQDNIKSRKDKRVVIEKISIRLKIAKSTVRKYLELLETRGEIRTLDFESSNYKQMNERKKRIEETKRMLQHNEEITSQEISAKLGVTVESINQYKRGLKAENETINENTSIGLQEERRTKKQELDKKIQEEEKKIQKIKLLLTQETPIKMGEIAQAADIYIKKIYEYERILKSRGELAKNESYSPKSRRMRQTKKLLAQGRTVAEIAENLGVTEITIRSYIKQLKSTGEVDKNFRVPRRTNKQNKEETNLKNKRKKKTRKEEITTQYIKKLCDDFYGQKEILKIFKDYITNCKSRFMEGILPEEELPLIEEVVKLEDDYNDMLLYLRICIKLKKYNNATKLINEQLKYNSELTEEQQKELKEIKEEIINTSKMYVAYQSLKKGEGVEKAASNSELPIETVQKINRKLMQKRKKDTNDDNEEPKI